ncbi:interleukin-11-like isoform X2 [Cetorhinus maximus]
MFIKEKLGGAALKGEHQLSSLPQLSGSAVDLEAVEAVQSLPNMQSYLRSYEKHLTWLRSTKPIAGTTLDSQISDVLTLLQNLANRVEEQMQRLNLAVSPATPFSPSETSDWETLRAGFVILRDLRTFINKAAHELLALQLRR